MIRYSVLQLGPFPPPNGGVQTNLTAIRSTLTAAAVPNYVINLTRFRQPDTTDVFYPEGGWAVFRLLFSLPHTIAHLHIGGNVTLRLLLLSLACCWMPGRKSVLTFHSGGYPSSPEGQTARRWTLRGFVFRRFDRIVCVNQAMVDMFIGKFGVPAARVKLILPFALPAALPAASLPTQVEEFLATHDPVLISMGWLEPEYDFALQIEALPAVREKLPRAGLLILGDGQL